MPRTVCPECDVAISIPSPREGATVTCHECGEKLEVISVNPFELDYPLDDDWGDEDD